MKTTHRGAWSQALLLAAVGGWVMLLQWQTVIEPAVLEAASMAVPQVELPAYPVPQVDESTAPADSTPPSF